MTRQTRQIDIIAAPDGSAPQRARHAVGWRLADADADARCATCGALRRGETSGSGHYCSRLRREGARGGHVSTRPDAVCDRYAPGGLQHERDTLGGALRVAEAMSRRPGGDERGWGHTVRSLRARLAVIDHLLDARGAS
jgi:hypothetical protein